MSYQRVSRQEYLNALDGFSEGADLALMHPGITPSAEAHFTGRRDGVAAAKAAVTTDFSSTKSWLERYSGRLKTLVQQSRRLERQASANSYDKAYYGGKAASIQEIKDYVDVFSLNRKWPIWRRKLTQLFGNGANRR